MAKRKKQDFSCPGCNKDFGGPAGLTRHYRKINDAHLARAIKGRFGSVRPSIWRKYRNTKAPGPHGTEVRRANKKNGAKPPDTSASSIPMTKRSSGAKRPVLRYCTSCGQRKRPGWAFCGNCGSKLTTRR